VSEIYFSTYEYYKLDLTITYIYCAILFIFSRKT